MISNLLLKSHIILGFVSLLLFWIPMFARKGGKAHGTSGKWYVYTMSWVVLSAALLSIENAIQGLYEGAVLLGYLTLITAHPLWYAIAILKNKRQVSDRYTKSKLFFDALVIICGALTLTYGFYLGGEGASILMIVFGFLGLTNIPDFVRDVRGRGKEESWIIVHLSGMLTSAIAAYTAFFAFGARTFFTFSGYVAVIPWILPTIIGLIVIARYKRKYAPRKALVSTK